MRTWQFLFASPSEGWKFATGLFSASWFLGMGLSLFIIADHVTPPLDWSVCTMLIVPWIIAASFVHAIFIHLIRLSNRIDELDRELNSLRQR
jgi:hypothetical protein